MVSIGLFCDGLEKNHYTMVDYPSFVDGQAPEITLKEYDVAPWALTTCVDRVDGNYVVVVMEKPSQVVARINANDNETLDRIFASAHKTHSEQLAQGKK